MATLYPVWRGSLTYHDGTLSHDGAALYRGTQCKARMIQCQKPLPGSELA